MKITFLSNASSSIIHLIFFLKTHNIDINEVVVESKNINDYFLLKDYAKKDKFKVHFVSDANSLDCKNLLEEIKPELMIIMISKILKDYIVQIPSIGTINVHAGILPQYRGVDSRRWAILEKGDIGISVHFVDVGVDSGDIIYRKKLSVKENENLAQITKRNYYQNRYQCLVKAIIKIMNNNVNPKKQKKEDGKQYFVMHSKLAKIVDLILEKNRGKNAKIIN